MSHWVEGGGLNVVSLFAGIGGFDLGLERAGMTVVASCEINPKCRHLLSEHWPHVQQFADICEMRAADVPHRVHVLCGGFPCQDLSFAGKGAGLAGERSGLWREYARLIGEFRPDYVIVENVSALLGRGLGDVLGDLAALGYDAWWDCIPAAAVGAPHRRDRIWIVAYARGQQHEGYGDALRREIAEGLSCAAAMADAAGNGRHEGYPDGGWRGSRGCPQQGAGPGGRGDEPPLAHAIGERGCGRDSERQHAVHAYPRRETFCAGRDGGWWSAEPDVGRTIDGFSRWLDETAGESEAHKVILAYANASDAGPGKALRDLRDSIRAEDDRRAAGGPISVSPEAVLFAFVREHARRAEEGLASLESAAPPADGVRGVRGETGASRPSLRSGRDEQRAGEPSDPLQVVSQLLARHAEAAWIAYRWPDAWASQPWVHGWEDGIARVAHAVPARVDRLHGLGNAVVPQIPEIIGRAIIAAQSQQREAA